MDPLFASSPQAHLYEIRKGYILAESEPHVTFLAKACSLALRASGYGSVINIGSIQGFLGPDPGMRIDAPMEIPAAAYAASKGGLIQLIRYMATILSPDNRVNSISLGCIERNQPDPFFSRYTSLASLGQMCTEEDAKGALAYLASNLSAYMTGCDPVIDGGWSTW